MAYLLPALTQAMNQDGTILVVAPTRELAVQLGRDAIMLLSNLNKESADDAKEAVVLSVAGMPTPTRQELDQATFLIGTPAELIHVVSNVVGGANMIAGDTLSAVILDEVDVLLPLPPKQLRTSLDDKNSDKTSGKPKKTTFDSAQEERRKQEQKRKLMTAKRQGAEMTSNDKQSIAPTERLLRLVASHRFVGGGNSKAPLILAGSATASRRTLDRLNQALRASAESGGAGTMESIWSGLVSTIRPNEDEKSNTNSEEEQQHTIRAVTVPQEVKHRYISMTKDEASSSDAVLSAVAKAAGILKPETPLIFFCGEFAKSNLKEKVAVAKPPPVGKTSQARRDLSRKRTAVATTKSGTTPTRSTEPLSARRACLTLQQMGIDAQPLHVAMGLEMNSKDQVDESVVAPFLVTFEGSARGLHFDEVDAVFVVGRPASAASYLHLAGRVGRSSPSDGGVVIRPGTVVSLCTKGSATELEKWTRQIGGTDLEELIIDQGTK